jgi:phosphoglucomutase
MKLALELGKAKKADLVMGTDPDADRIGVAAPDDGSFRLVTGNELGALLLDYVLGTRRELGALPGNGIVIKTIVTTELQRLIAEHFNVRCLDVLTGFKYIGEKIREFEDMKDGPVFLFGNEESYGYLTSPEVRDKDAVSTAVLTAEMALYHQSRGKTLVDRLKELWREYGYFKETGIAGSFRGETGLQTMGKLMERLRTDPPAGLAGLPVVMVKDYEKGTTTTAATRAVKKDIDLPSSNVLQFLLADGTLVTARPSGTEPKIKFYLSCRGPAGAPVEASAQRVQQKIDALSGQIRKIIDEA